MVENEPKVRSEKGEKIVDGKENGGGGKKVEEEVRLLEERYKRIGGTGRGKAGKSERGNLERGEREK